VNYQFAPGTLAINGANRAAFGDVAEMAWAGSCPWVASLRCGGPLPSDGWICRSLGVREPAPRLTLEANMTGGTVSLLTILAPPDRGGRRVALVPAHGGHIVRVTGSGGTDWVAARSLSGGEGPIDSDALVSVCRIENGREVERHSINGHYLHVDVGALGDLEQSLAMAAPE
jgi:hypothetical protein